MESSRVEHLQFCKQRAREYAERGDFINAMASMGSDLDKHPETAKHPAMELWMMLYLSGHMNNVAEVMKFIDGFN